MGIDHNTWRSLEIEWTMRDGSREGSLLHSVDRTVHSAGARRLRSWFRMPLIDGDAIVERQDAVGSLIELEGGRQTLRQMLKGMADVERIAGRVVLGRCTPRDLVGLGRTLSCLPALQAELASFGPEVLGRIKDDVGGLDELAELLGSALREDAPLTIRDGGIIADEFDSELDTLRAVSRDGQAWLASYQQAQIEATGIPSLKVGYNRVFGYYIEVSNTHRDKVPSRFVRKQTIRNAERYITDELKVYEDKMLTAGERATVLEAKLFEELRVRTAAQVAALQRVADALATLDVLISFAQYAVERRCVRPEIVSDRRLEIRDGRHPVLDQILTDGFVPNDCALDEKTRVIMITGPNMSGKSTFIRQAALLTLLAQTGGFVPAARMTFSPVDRIFARVGAADAIMRGQSTFMVEMTEAANILNSATDRSLVVLDEIGRGTSTFDGLSLAWAITEHLVGRTRCLTMVATHYHELTALAGLLDGVANFNVAVREWSGAGDGPGEIVFLHRIVPGGSDKSYGVHVARIAGLPAVVVGRSLEILAELERGFGRDVRTPTLAKRGTQSDPQMTLFEDPGDVVLRMLGELDVNQMTPIEAFRKIEELIRRAKGS